MTTENAIRQLLGLNEPVSKENGQDLSNIHSPEMYFKLPRLKNLTPEQSPSTVEQPKQYTLPQTLALNNFAVEGKWQFGNDHAELIKGPGKIQLHFSSGKVFMVAASAKPVMLKIMVDGKQQNDVTVQMSQLLYLV